MLLSDQSPIIVKFDKYDKNLNFLVKKEFKCSLLKCLDLALENAANYNDVSAIIDNTSWKRIETCKNKVKTIEIKVRLTKCLNNLVKNKNRHLVNVNLGHLDEKSVIRLL